MGRINNWIMIISLILMIAAFWNRNDLPEKVDAISQLSSEPKQTAVNKPAFEVDYSGVRYIVEPQYEYELFGLVVSYRHHDGDTMLHKVWNDHLNTSDVCVVWGRTALNAYLNKLKFWNGQFTCNVKTKNSVAWNSFDIYELSNNHLISGDDYLRDKIKSLHIGDQIRIAGFLSSYRSEGGGTRGTSTTRKDTGNGACETIYVNEFDIIKPTSNNWRSLLYISFGLFLFSLAVHFFSPYRVK